MVGVDPLRILPVQQRMREAEPYLDHDDPTDKDRWRHANRLDLSVNQFLGRGPYAETPPEERRHPRG